jgi:antitoxin component YwqK of YwqJK toxin-antitoxin module
MTTKTNSGTWALLGRVARRMSILLVVTSFVNCERTSTQEQSGQGTADQPGIVKQFSDMPDLATSEIRDAADQIITTGYYLNGLKENSWIDYEPATGIVSTVTNYMRGKKEGVLLVFHPVTQQLVRMSFFHNDLLDGEYREFTGTTLQEVRHYENGKLEGISKLFYDTGVLMEAGNYRNGVRDGASKWYDQKGNLTIEYEYKKGQLVEK